jgi:glycosyltransferase involved in cell wall biosynthesis
MMKSRVPFFSVITPTHLRAPLLRRALESLRAQTFQDFEIIVAADAMDAETGAVVAELLGENDTFIKHNAGAGPATSRNAAMQAARGDWVAFLDDDDIFRPHHLQAMHAHASRTSEHVLFSDYEVITEDRSKPELGQLGQMPLSLAAIPPATVHVKNFIPNNVLVYRRTVLEGVTVDPHLRSLEDWDFILGVCAKAMPAYVPGGGAVVYKDYVNTGNRRGTQESSNDNTVLADFLHVYRRWPAPNMELKQARQALLKTNGLDLPVNWF